MLKSHQPNTESAPAHASGTMLAELGGAIAQPAILIVEDDRDALESLSRSIIASGLKADIYLASAANRARDVLHIADPHVVLLDLCLDAAQGVEAGFELLKFIAASLSKARIIVLTGHGSAAHGVRALQLGAASFIEKPADIPHLLALIHDAISQSALKRAFEQVNSSKKDLLSQLLVGDSPAMQRVCSQILHAARTPQSVLLLGETGTGKGVCARAIHQLSSRQNHRLVRYQPTFSSADIVNSDLFGHVRGAFTGAQSDRKGLVMEAEGGSLFLDEVDQLPLENQVVLLGVLQERKLRPLGTNKEEKVNFRLICASNADLGQRVIEGKLRQDFLHRINHLTITLPPLRDRIEDLPALAQRTLCSLREAELVEVFELEQDALDKLSSYNWPGNVRELEAVIEGAAYLASFSGRSRIMVDDISLSVCPNSLIADSALEAYRDLNDQVSEFKKRLVTNAMSRTGGNQVKAAEELGIDRSSLRRLLGKKK